MRVVVRPKAVTDIGNAAIWYNSQRSGLGDDFEAAVAETLEVLAESPQIYQLITRTVRRASPRPFPYSIYFRIRDQQVEILRVLHQSRLPELWKQG